MSFRVELSTTFERSYQELIRTHYQPNDPNIAVLDAGVGEFIAALRLQPHLLIARFEPWPGKVRAEGWQFFKIRFALPGLTGAAAVGRLTYLVDRPNSTVYLFMIYSHKQFEKRPPEKRLIKAFKDLFEMLKDR